MVPADDVTRLIDAGVRNWGKNTWTRLSTILLLAGYAEEVTDLYRFLVSQAQDLSAKMSDAHEETFDSTTVEQFSELAQEAVRRMYAAAYYYCLAGVVPQLGSRQDMKTFDHTTFPQSVRSILVSASSQLIGHITGREIQLAYLWSKQEGTEHLRYAAAERHSAVSQEELFRVTRGSALCGVVDASLKLQGRSDFWPP